MVPGNEHHPSGGTTSLPPKHAPGAGRKLCMLGFCSFFPASEQEGPALGALISRYSREFSRWLEKHGFDGMQKSVRSVALELHENAEAIEAWRSTLPQKQRRRLVHPLSNLRRWRASTAHGNGRSPADLRRDAKAAWARFCACLQALPADEALSLWQAAQAQAAVALGATPT